MSEDERGDDQSRRSFVKKAVYVAPIVITLDAMPAFASHECSWHAKQEDYYKEKDKEKEKENYKGKNEQYFEEKEKKEKKEKKAD